MKRISVTFGVKLVARGLECVTEKVTCIFGPENRPKIRIRSISLAKSGCLPLQVQINLDFDPEVTVLGNFKACCFGELANERPSLKTICSITAVAPARRSGWRGDVMKRPGVGSWAYT